jgi:hypothetical protein
LQYAAAQQWGDKEYNRLDKYTLAVPHPDATAALLAGGTELNGHFSNPPFQDQVLANKNVHVVLNSYDLLGPNSPTLLFATEKFRKDNPKTYKAFVDALAEAADFAQKDKAAAADTYIRVTKAKIDRDALIKLIDNPQYEFTVTPKNTYKLADFLYRVGAIKHKPEEKQYSQWVKIDIEIDDILKVLKEQGIDTAQVKQKFSLAAMPFTAEDMFSPESMNEEQKAQLDKLWDTEFAMKIKPEVFIKEDSDQPKATGGIASAAQIPDIPEESEEVNPTTDPAQSQSPEGLDSPTDDTTGERTTEEE